jgi:hypothetical protein
VQSFLAKGEDGLVHRYSLEPSSCEQQVLDGSGFADQMLQLQREVQQHNLDVTRFALRCAAAQGAAAKGAAEASLPGTRKESTRYVLKDGEQPSSSATAPLEGFITHKRSRHKQKRNKELGKAWDQSLG